jgi:ribose 5-phosphate isomerase A
MAAAATAVRFHATAARRAAPRRAARFAVRADAAQTATALTQDDLKRLAAVRAVEQVESGMVLGLGTGSTAAFAVAEIGALLANGKLSKIVGVPTSKRTYEQALSLGIPLSTLDDHPVIDLAIDGADEVLPLASLLLLLLRISFHKSSIVRGNIRKVKKRVPLMHSRLRTTRLVLFLRSVRLWVD